MSETCPHCGAAIRQGQTMCRECELFFRSVVSQQPPLNRPVEPTTIEPAGPIPAVIPSATVTTAPPSEEELLPEDDSFNPNWLDWQAYTLSDFRIFIYGYLLVPVGILLGGCYLLGCRTSAGKEAGRKQLFNAILGTLLLIVIYYSITQTKVNWTTQ